ncbi:GNAT family N-acetyltransferase [Clostridium folliculivorans]|uniref:N-acetyltransferase n=1 Tax=Clostridium folliculivorans TaxID=2886038 RepID=A0A9W6DA78_9CLOT|nr:GNAT family N-acetyltransferase [Clostridium folliculivorans]GKU25095.1 N-acetyltransferase [Clostridium folliculivorans]GKU31193.1 N-acetyltransferase [Clostridium folliculivorans]
MSKKFLESERLLLKPLSFRELQYINNNEINNVENPIESESIMDSVKLAISKKIRKMQNINEDIHEWYTYWLIINKENKKGMGFIGFKGVPDINGYSEVGYSISPNYRKRGFMTEALETSINWAYGFQDAKGITAEVLRTNIGSIRVLNNCNFKLVSSTEQVHNYIIKFR